MGTFLLESDGYMDKARETPLCIVSCTKVSLQRTLLGNGPADSLLDFYAHFGLPEAKLISMVVDCTYVPC